MDNQPPSTPDSEQPKARSSQCSMPIYRTTPPTSPRCSSYSMNPTPTSSKAIARQHDPKAMPKSAKSDHGSDESFAYGCLGDTITDTGCSLRVMKREIALKLPLEFKGMHRFIPATARHLGYTVIEMPVSHRHRHAGNPQIWHGDHQACIARAH